MCTVLLPTGGNPVAVNKYISINISLINGTVFEHKMCVLIISVTFSEIFLILRRTERDIITNIRRSSCDVPVILVRF
jgi:hypothetical protein